MLRKASTSEERRGMRGARRPRAAGASLGCATFQFLQSSVILITALRDPVGLPCTLSGMENKVRYWRNKVRTLDLG